MPGRINRLLLTTVERVELESRSRSPTAGPEDCRRARLILLLADGLAFREIQRLLSCNEHYILRWKRRFLAERLAGLYSRHAGRPPTALSEDLQAAVERALEDHTAAGSEPWSCRKLARDLGVQPALVSRAAARAPVNPGFRNRNSAHRAPRVASEILGIYLNPPQHAIVLRSMDSRSIQHFDGLDPLVLFSLGQSPAVTPEQPAETTRELDGLIESGQLLTPSTGRHTSAELVAFLAEIASHYRADPLEILADNPVTARSTRFRLFLAEHATVRVDAVDSVMVWLLRVEDRVMAGDSRSGFGNRLMCLLRRACEEHLSTKWFFRRSSKPE